nr:Rrf2 family transcriptional regulator [Maliibacterium massiliense]
MTSEFSIALHALAYLAKHPAACVSSQQLAENVCTNPARIRKVMAALKKADLITTKEGIGGGYRIGRAAGDITLDALPQALGMPIVPAPAHTGDVDCDCMIASGMGAVMDDLCVQLDQSCRACLARMTLADIIDTLAAHRAALQTDDAGNEVIYHEG